jgi:hypothetical protein
MDAPDEVQYAVPRCTGRVVLVSAIWAAVAGNVIALLDLAGHGEFTRWFVSAAVAMAIAAALARGWVLARRDL